MQLFLFLPSHVSFNFKFMSPLYPMCIIFLSSTLPDGRVFSWGGGEAESEPSPPKEEVTAFEEPRIRTQNTFKNFVRPSLVSLKQSTRGKVLSIAASRELVLLCHKS